MNSVLLLRIVQQINFWGMFMGLAALIYLANWWYLVVCLISVILLAKVGLSVGQHRYFSHRSFTTTARKATLLRWLATLSTTGSTLQYATVHRHHHRYSDTPQDLHSPRYLGRWRTWFHWYDQDPSSVAGASIVRDLLRDTHIVWHHRHYWLIISGYILCLAVIDPWLVLFCYIVPCGYAWTNAGIQSLVLHDTDDDRPGDRSKNSILWNAITLGEGLHENHHRQPAHYRFTNRTRDFDFPAWLIEKFFLRSI